MTRCEWIRFAYRVLPLAAWRAFLLDRHIDRCPRCQERAIGVAAVRRLAMSEARLAGEPPLRPFAGERDPDRRRGLSHGWRYAFGVLAVSVLAGIAVEIWRAVSPPESPQGIVSVSEAEEAPRVFAVLEARIGGEPARPVVFKPGRPGMTIVWFEKAKKSN